MQKALKLARVPLAMCSVVFDHELWERMLAEKNPGIIEWFKKAHPNLAVMAEDLWLEHLRYLYIAVVSGERNAPSRTVDYMWHAHILFTEDYGRFCQKYNGGMIHHRPVNSAEEKTTFPRTRQLIDELFGETNHLIWGELACCKCGADCD